MQHMTPRVIVNIRRREDGAAHRVPSWMIVLCPDADTQFIVSASVNASFVWGSVTWGDNQYVHFLRGET
jgi:hypothetical protein